MAAGFEPDDLPDKPWDRRRSRLSDSSFSFSGLYNSNFSGMPQKVTVDPSVPIKLDSSFKEALDQSLSKQADVIGNKFRDAVRDLKADNRGGSHDLADTASHGITSGLAQGVGQMAFEHMLRKVQHGESLFDFSKEKAAFSGIADTLKDIGKVGRGVFNAARSGFGKVFDFFKSKGGPDKDQSVQEESEYKQESLFPEDEFKPDSHHYKQGELFPTEKKKGFFSRTFGGLFGNKMRDDGLFGRESNFEDREIFQEGSTEEYYGSPLGRKKKTSKDLAVVEKELPEPKIPPIDSDLVGKLLNESKGNKTYGAGMGGKPPGGGGIGGAAGAAPVPPGGGGGAAGTALATTATETAAGGAGAAGAAGLDIAGMLGIGALGVGTAGLGLLIAPLVGKAAGGLIKSIGDAFSSITNIGGILGGAVAAPVNMGLGGIGSMAGMIGGTGQGGFFTSMANSFSAKDMPGSGLMSFATLGMSDQFFGVMDKLKQTVGQVTDAFIGLLHKGLNPAVDINSLVSPFKSQVQAFNPASVERFNLALDNLSAAAGKAFVPVIEAARQFADELNVLYTSVSDDFRSLFQAIAEPVKDFAREFAVGFIGLVHDAVTTITPILQEMKPLGQTVGVVVREVFDGIAEVGGHLVNEFNELTTDINQVIYSLTGFNFNLGTSVSAIQTFSATLIAGARAIAHEVSRFSLTDLMLGATSYGQGRAIAGGVNVANDFKEEFRRIQQEFAEGSRAFQGPRTFAAQPARVVGLEELGQQARASALSQGTDVQQRQLDQQITMTEWLQKIEAAIKLGYTSDQIAKMKQMAEAQAVMNGGDNINGF